MSVGGDYQLGVDRQVIIPYVNCNNSDGSITRITATLQKRNRFPMDFHAVERYGTAIFT